MLLQLAEKATIYPKRTRFSHQRGDAKAIFCLRSKSSARGASRASAHQGYEPPHQVCIELPASATGIYSKSPVPHLLPERSCPAPPPSRALRSRCPSRRESAWRTPLPNPLRRIPLLGPLHRRSDPAPRSLHRRLAPTPSVARRPMRRRQLPYTCALQIQPTSCPCLSVRGRRTRPRASCGGSGPAPTRPFGRRCYAV